MAKAAPGTEIWTIEVFKLKGHDGVSMVVESWPISCPLTQAKALVNGMVRRFYPKNGDAVRVVDKDGEEKHRRTWWDEQRRSEIKHKVQQAKRVAKERADEKRPPLARSGKRSGG